MTTTDARITIRRVKTFYPTRPLWSVAYRHPKYGPAVAIRTSHAEAIATANRIAQGNR